MFVKLASDSAVATTDHILERIRQENPAHWPNGLTRAHFDGGLYLISKSASMEPVGFVGWQERDEERRKVGYYSIGVLPEFRHQGFAKRAVATILQEKSAGVDEVRAMVMSTNVPSKRLAESLGVAVMEKAANNFTKGLGYLGKGLLTAGLIDGSVNKDKGAIGAAMGVEGADPWTGVDFSLNTLAGMAAAPMWGNPKLMPLAAALTSIAAGKTIAAPAVRNMREGNTIAKLQVDATQNLANATAAAKPEGFKIPNSLIYGGIGLGAAGIGTAGIISLLKMRAESKRQDKASEDARKGRIRVTLPTKNPGDSETTIDMPTEGFDMSGALQDKLKRDTRRRLLEETRGRTRRRKPVDPNNLTDIELNDAELDAEQEALDAEDASAISRLTARFNKAAAAASVPSPPAQGTNPALRMSQEAQAAQQAASGAATDSNPQIMQAQQATAAAEQSAQQQISEMQQASQQEGMQRDQAHQQALAAKDQEIFRARQEAEIQKTQIEKVKVETELAQAKMEAAQELESNRKEMTDSMSNSENSTVNKMTKHRLSRIRSLVSKAAAADPFAAGTHHGTQRTQVTPQPRNPPLNPTTPVQVPKNNAPNQLALGTAQDINRNGGEFIAMRGMVPTHAYRTSYGQIGDAAYDMLARPFLMTPSQNATVDLSKIDPSALGASPDLYDKLLRGGQQILNTPV